MFEILLFVLVFVLACLNGANDISKGIATLVGGNVMRAWSAILWGTITTAMGTIAGVAIIVWPALMYKIALPLALSPVISFAVAWLIFPLIRRALSGVNSYCLCLEVQQTQIIPAYQLAGKVGAVAAPSRPELQVVADKVETCEQTVSLSAVKLRLADSLHLITSGLTSFARGLNDTPKIAALLVGTAWLGDASPVKIFGLVAVGMCAGSLLGGRKVLETLSGKITAMDGLEGFTANFGASALVTTATFLGLPLSTTHVTTSAIVGIGAHIRGRTNWGIVRDIAMAWLVTLPTAAILAYIVSMILKL